TFLLLSLLSSKYPPKIRLVPLLCSVFSFLAVASSSSTWEVQPLLADTKKSYSGPANYGGYYSGKVGTSTPTKTMDERPCSTSLMVIYDLRMFYLIATD
ncbi:hypothetical protein N7489_005014, partial [Penicillium chrysogenum]|uniref:uncharacterized protein n=1 Tax=Penicillium chrysogenum TaxID=5076 RepID=UPI0024DF0A92